MDNNIPVQVSLEEQKIETGLGNGIFWPSVIANPRLKTDVNTYLSRAIIRLRKGQW